MVVALFRHFAGQRSTYTARHRRFTALGCSLVQLPGCRVGINALKENVVDRVTAITGGRRADVSFEVPACVLPQEWHSERFSRFTAQNLWTRRRLMVG